MRVMLFDHACYGRALPLGACAYPGWVEGIAEVKNVSSRGKNTMYFNVAGETVDSVELKCLVISRGLKIDREVYQKCGRDYLYIPCTLSESGN